MPDRILRAGIITSERVNKLSESAEVFYRRLMSVVDDFGLFDARPVILMANLYPLRLDTITAEHINNMLHECESAGLLMQYQKENKPFLMIIDFKQRLRAKRSKFPLPDSEVRADDRNVQSHDRNVRADAGNFLPSVGIGIGIGDEYGDEYGDECGNESETFTPSHSNEPSRASSLDRQPIIPDKKKVYEEAVRIQPAGMDTNELKEACLSFYNKYESTGWYNRGSPITNFKPLLETFFRNWTKLKDKDTFTPTPSAPPLTRAK